MMAQSAGLNRQRSDNSDAALITPVKIWLQFARLGSASRHEVLLIMNLTAFLDVDAIRLDLSASNKRQLLNQMAQIAASRLSLDPSMIADAVGERERLGSTGFGGGVAIPHGKLADLDRVYALVARLAQPIDYKAIDGAPVDLVFLLLSPPDAGAEHLKALAAVSRLVRNASTIEKIRGARTHDALAAVLLHAEERDAA